MPSLNDLWVELTRLRSLIGLGGTTLTANGVLYGSASGAVLVTAQGPANSVLTANAGAPVFSATPTIGGQVTITAGANPTAAPTGKMSLGGGGISPNGTSITFGDSTGWKLRFGSILAGAFRGVVNITDNLGMSIGLPAPNNVADARLQVGGHIHSTGTTPTVLGCVGGAVTAGSTDQAGEVIEGAGLTTCSFNFGTAWANAPWCVASNSAGLTVVNIVATASTFSVNSTAVGAHIAYVCMGRG